jgi:hypothetical protein
MLDSVGMLSVPDREWQLKINHVFNIYHGRAPEYLCENLILIKEIQGEPLIQILLLQAQMYVALIAFHNAIRDWNSLPISIKNVNNKEAFKNAVKEFLKIEARRREENEYFYF